MIRASIADALLLAVCAAAILLTLLAGCAGRAHPRSDTVVSRFWVANRIANRPWPGGLRRKAGLS